MVYIYHPNKAIIHKKKRITILCGESNTEITRIKEHLQNTAGHKYIMDTL